MTEGSSCMTELPDGMSSPGLGVNSPSQSSLATPYYLLCQLAIDLGSTGPGIVHADRLPVGWSSDNRTFLGIMVW
jgi:hypothetical protein